MGALLLIPSSWAVQHPVTLQLGADTGSQAGAEEGTGEVGGGEAGPDRADWEVRGVTSSQEKEKV